MKNRVRTILTNLESVREDLLALSDDIWHSIETTEAAPLLRRPRYSFYTWQMSYGKDR